MQHRVTDFMTLVVSPLIKNSSRSRKKQTALYAAYDIKSQHVMVLFFLGHHSSGLTVTELANFCCEDKSATSRAPLNILSSAATPFTRKTSPDAAGVPR